MYLPFDYEQINQNEGLLQPSVLKEENNKSFDYWVRTLFHRAASTLVFGLPEYWEGSITDFFYYLLLHDGFMSIQDLTGKIPVGSDNSDEGDNIGMCFYHVGLEGRNFYLQPRYSILSNHVLNNTYRLEIGKECELLKLTPDFRGIWDVIERYAAMLSNLDNAINMSIVNNKFAFVLAGKTKAAVEALKKIVDKINSGEPAVFVDSRLMNDQQSKETPFQDWTRDNLKNSYLTTDQLLDMHTILNDFDSEIGIPTIPYQKKERETEFESKSKVADGMARSLVWKRCIESSLKKINTLYPELNITFKLRWEVVEDVNNEDDDDRS